MKPKEIKKEQAESNANPIKPIESKDIDNIPTNKQPVELEKPQPVDITPPKESDRQFGKKVKDYSSLVEDTGKYGIDLSNLDKMPTTDADREKITNYVRGSVPKELVGDFNNYANSYNYPQNEERNKLDQKKLLEAEKKQRRIRWADALYAFGEGLQGKTANPENFASNRIQRKQDEQFQAFRDTTERNKKAKYIADQQYRNDLVNWLEAKAKDASLTAKEQQKFQQLADFHKDEMRLKERGLDIQEQRNKIAANKSGKVAKEDKPVIIQTSKKRYELAPEEAALYKGEALKNAEILRKKYPGWFNPVPKVDEYGSPIQGQFTYKLDPRVKDTDVIRAYLEDKENPTLNENAYEQNKNTFFDKYRKEKGLPTSNVPVSETTKAGQTQKPKVKADPLGLGI